MTVFAARIAASPGRRRSHRNQAQNVFQEMNMDLLIDIMMLEKQMKYIIIIIKINVMEIHVNLKNNK